MPYDVFISFKNTDPNGGLTVDRSIAETLHRKLTDEGLEVFFSEKDLRTTAFMDEIYTALDQAHLLLLIASDLEYINSRWVKSEWSTFYGSIQSGRKPKAEIITVLNGLSTRQIPIQLEHYESFGFNDLDKVVDFVFKTLRRVKITDVKRRMADDEEQRRREAEFAAIREMRLKMEQEMLDNLKSSSADEELNLRLQMERDQPSESSDGGYDLVYPSRHLGTQMPSHSYDYNGDGIHPVRHQTASANTVKRTRPSGVSAMPGFHTHNYEYTRQEIDSLEEQAHSELRRRVSAEMQNYVSDTPVPPPSPVAPKPAVYVRENDEDEAAAEAEILFRRLNND